MAYRGGASGFSTTTTVSVTVNGIGIQQNDIVLLCLINFVGNTVTWPSGFTQVPGTSPEVNDGNSGVYVFYKVATSSEPSSYSTTSVSFGGTLVCQVYSGRNTVSPFTAVQQTAAGTAGVFPKTFAITGLTAAAGDDVVVFVGEQRTGGSGAVTLAYTPSSGFGDAILGQDVSGVAPNWLAASDQLNVSAGATGAIAGSISVTSGATPGQTGYLAQVISLAALVVNLAEGTSTGATTAATGQGTGGVAMPAIVVGQETDVLVGIQNSSLPSTLVVGDGSNTYTQIDTFNDAGNGYIWYRFASRATVALATPTLTATANAGYFPTSMSIAAAPLSNVTGFTAGNVSHNQQLSPAGTDGQVSGFTPNISAGSYTIAAFGFSSSKATAPAAGTGFTQIATAWSALGTGACLTYETKTISSAGGVGVQSTFTPTTGRAYTLEAAFNGIGLALLGQIIM